MGKTNSGHSDLGAGSRGQLFTSHISGSRLWFCHFLSYTDGLKGVGVSFKDRS